MEIVTDVVKANKLLELYKGASFQLAIYDISHKRMAIRVFKSNSDQVVYLVGVSCLRMNGDFHVQNSQLLILDKLDEETKQMVTVVKDLISGFELYASGGVTLAYGLESEFGTTFHSFIK